MESLVGVIHSLALELSRKSFIAHLFLSALLTSPHGGGTMRTFPVVEAFPHGAPPGNAIGRGLSFDNFPQLSGAMMASITALTLHDSTHPEQTLAANLSTTKRAPAPPTSF